MSRSSPPTPGSSTPPVSCANRLDVGSRAFVPRAAAKLTIKKANGTEVSLEILTKNTHMLPKPAVSSPQSVVLRQGSLGTPNRRPTTIRMRLRIIVRAGLHRLKAEAADKEKKKKSKRSNVGSKKKKKGYASTLLSTPLHPTNDDQIDWI